MAKRETKTDVERAMELAWANVRGSSAPPYGCLTEAERLLLMDAMWPQWHLIAEGIRLGRALATKGGKSTKKGKINGKA